MDQKQLDDLSHEADSLGVSVVLDLMPSEPCVWIEKIARVGSLKGAAGEVLRRLLALTDEACISVRAAVWAENEGLLAWYLGLGFVVERMPEDLEGHDDHATIVRHPCGPSRDVRRPQLQEA